MTPLETVRAFMTRMQAKDIDGAMKFIAPECEYTNIPMGTVRGPGGVRATLEPFFAPIKQNEFKELRAASEGPFVFLERLDRHRTAKGWWELPVTGVYEVRDGRIAVWRDYFDLATAQKGMSSGA
ncbi:limonene-1,2-epoxide hydrolase family protein [Terricaulis sp.]|uniref:limonene-1,2-epoxide hydrolase family protein n=1 Tax=Terricaulis sp. TaxID=2768686 RepID=UPI00378463D8